MKTHYAHAAAQIARTLAACLAFTAAGPRIDIYVLIKQAFINLRSKLAHLADNFLGWNAR